MLLPLLPQCLQESQWLEFAFGQMNVSFIFYLAQPSEYVTFFLFFNFPSNFIRRSICSVTRATSIYSVEKLEDKKIISVSFEQNVVFLLFITNFAVQILSDISGP